MNIRLGSECPKFKSLIFYGEAWYRNDRRGEIHLSEDSGNERDPVEEVGGLMQMI